MDLTETDSFKASCYVEDVLDKNGIKRAKLIFDSNCNLIDDANNYLKEQRITSFTSYNSINVVARELCHLYSFLNYKNLEISDVNIDLIVNFIEYLKEYEKKNNKYAIENTIIQLKEVETDFNNVTKLFDSNKLSVISIAKIVHRVFLYLIHLQDEEKIDIKKFIKKIDTSEKRKRFLKSRHLSLNQDEEEVHDNMMIKMITKEQINFMKMATSSNNNYQRFLYLILELTGIRCGEALGLMIDESNCKDIRDIKGDIQYKNDIWILRVVAGRDNPHDSLTKNNRSREISIATQFKQEFEMVFQRYINFRNRVKKKNEKNSWLFLNTKGKKLTHNTAYRRFKRLVKVVFFERSNYLTIHSYRHFFCTNELLNGTPLEIVAKLAGHKNPQTTYRTYIHFGGKEMNELRDKYGPYYNKTIRS